MLEREETSPVVKVPDLPKSPAQETVPEFLVLPLAGAPRLDPGARPSFEASSEPGEGLARGPDMYVAPLGMTLPGKPLLNLPDQHVILGAVRPVAVGLQRP